MNLLTDPLFRVLTDQGPEERTLPGLLAALGADVVESLPGLQRHQEDAFYIFLCYLAAAVLDREKNRDPAQRARWWHDGLARLTGAHNEKPWMLVGENVLQSAFLQPALPENDGHALKLAASTPDGLDILPTAKNHDIKSARSVSAHPDEWIYALVSLQTMAGYFGAGNYGIARMNGGFSSRICVELQHSSRLGARWQRAVARLLALRSTLLTSPWPYRPDGHLLLWTVPWNGVESLRLSTLDPFFIEVTRVVRLAKDDGGRILAQSRPSKAARIEAKEQLGVLGDPWIPINQGKKATTALTVSPAGLTPELLQKMIFGEGIQPAPMQQPAPEEIGEPVNFYASVLVRGQGTTDGYHSCRIPIPTQASFALFGGGPGRERLGRLSREGLSDARTMQNKILKVALFSLLEAGPDKLNFGKREVSDWVSQAARAFTEEWSRDYFDWLWRTLDHDQEDRARLEWLKALQRKAWHVFGDASERLPKRRGRQYRAQVRARGLFFGALNKYFPELKEAHDAQRTN